MKVADLMKDLETGDRSMEHLKTSEVERTAADIAGILNQLSGSGLGNLQQANLGMNQWQNNQYAAQQNSGLRSISGL